ncbi:hypothetical protein QTP86_015032, partial [Hemibagrus guttatus]
MCNTAVMSRAGKIGKRKDLSEFDKGQIAMVGPSPLDHLQNFSSCGVFPVCT